MGGLPYQTFLDAQNMAAFWDAVKYFLFYIGPIVMIWFAVTILGRFVRMIRGTVVGDDERRRGKDDDDDNIYYY